MPTKPNTDVCMCAVEPENVDQLATLIEGKLIALKHLIGVIVTPYIYIERGTLRQVWEGRTYHIRQESRRGRMQALQTC